MSLSLLFRRLSFANFLFCLLQEMSHTYTRGGGGGHVPVNTHFAAPKLKA